MVRNGGIVSGNQPVCTCLQMVNAEAGGMEEFQLVNVDL